MGFLLFIIVNLGPESIGLMSHSSFGKASVGQSSFGKSSVGQNSFGKASVSSFGRVSASGGSANR